MKKIHERILGNTSTFWRKKKGDCQKSRGSVEIEIS